MKNPVLLAAKSMVILAAVVTMSSFRTTTNSNANSTGTNNTLSISVSIPDQWSQTIIREDEDQATTFKFNNGNAPGVFLFSVTKIPDQQWAKVKSQMPDVKLIAHKNNSIYFVQKTTKESIKGSNNEAYQAVYKSLDNLINSIQINE